MSDPANIAAADIAARFLGIPTLETRHADSLDFYERSVWRIREALVAAYTAGQRSQNPP